MGRLRITQGVDSVESFLYFQGRGNILSTPIFNLSRLRRGVARIARLVDVHTIRNAVIGCEVGIGVGPDILLIA